MKRTKVVRIYLDTAGQADSHKIFLPFAKQIKKMIATSSVLRASSSMLEKFAPEIYDIEETAPGRLEIAGAYFTSETVVSSPGFSVLSYAGKRAGRIVALVSFTAPDGATIAVKAQNKVYSVSADYFRHGSAAPAFEQPMPYGWKASAGALAWSLPPFAGLLPVLGTDTGVYSGLKGFAVRNPDKRALTVSQGGASWDCSGETTIVPAGVQPGSLRFSAPAGTFGEVRVSLMLSDVAEIPTFPDTGGGGTGGPNYTVDIDGDGAINASDDQDGDGDTDAADQAIFDAANGGGGGTGPNYTADINGDGAINASDDQDGDGDTDAVDQAIFDAANGGGGGTGPNYTVDINGDGIINAADDMDGDGDTDISDSIIFGGTGGGGAGPYTRDINLDGAIDAADDIDNDGDTDSRDQALWQSGQQ